jgi:hypothetical protein
MKTIEYWILFWGGKFGEENTWVHIGSSPSSTAVFGHSGMYERLSPFLKRIRQDVDPDKVFQRLQPGYFKISDLRERMSKLEL